MQSKQEWTQVLQFFASFQFFICDNGHPRTYKKQDLGCHIKQKQYLLCDCITTVSLHVAKGCTTKLQIVIGATIGKSSNYDFCLSLGGFLFEKVRLEKALKIMQEVFSNGSWLQIISITLMIFVDVMSSIGILHSYMFDCDNVSERKNMLELQTNFKTLIVVNSWLVATTWCRLIDQQKT